MYLLMTRPRAASDRFVAQLPARTRSRVTVIHSPLIEIRPLQVQTDLAGMRGMVFTSANAVNAAVAMGVDRDLPAYCVGPTTTGTATSAGWQAQMMGSTAEELIANLLQHRPHSPLMHLRGEHTRGNIAERLTESGLTVQEQSIYRQTLLSLSDEALAIADGDAPVLAPLFSPRTARQFADIWPGTAPLWLAAISPATAEPLETLAHAQLTIAKEPTPDKMRKAVKKLVNLAMRVESARRAD